MLKPATCAADSPPDPLGHDRRIAGLDALRVPAIFAVICLHCLPFEGHAFEGPLFHAIADAVKLGARFAVPSFFILSGYFFGKRLRSGAKPGGTLLRYTKRLLLVFAVWSLIYLVLPVNLRQIGQYGVLRNTYWKWSMIWEQPLSFLFEGGSTHLWFLTALVSGLAVLTLFVAKGWQRGLAAVCIALYALHFLAGPYKRSRLGFVLPFDPRNGPLVSTLFVGIGWFLSSDRLRVKTVVAVAIAAGGLLLHALEAFHLRSLYGVSPGQQEFLLGTIPFATGLVLLFLANADWGNGRFCAALGGLTLGVYVAHPLCIRLLQPVGDYLAAAWWEIAFPFIIYGLAVLLTILLSQRRLTRRVVILGRGDAGAPQTSPA